MVAYDYRLHQRHAASRRAEVHVIRANLNFAFIILGGDILGGELESALDFNLRHATFAGVLHH